MSQKLPMCFGANFFTNYISLELQNSWIFYASKNGLFAHCAMTSIPKAIPVIKANERLRDEITIVAILRYGDVKLKIQEK